MILSNKKGVQYIVQSLATLGLKEVVICPGSRSAPFVISFNRHAAFNCISIKDERSAAFVALGKAITLQRPVALVCTSGSAPLNFAPAIAEAYYQRVPLIIITADRLKEWTDQGDGQTINQTNVFQNYIRKSYELKGDATATSELWHIQRCLSEGWNIAISVDNGPIHFNIPLAEPLYDTEEVNDFSVSTFSTLATDTLSSNETFQLLADDFTNCNKVMILAGQNNLNENVQDALVKIAELDNVVVLTESTANIHHEHFIENIDRCITGFNDEQNNAFKPDLLITLGGAIISKRVKTFLRKYKPLQHWNIHPYDSMMDTYQSLTRAVRMDAYKFLNTLLPLLYNTPSDYKRHWLRLNEEKFQRHHSFIPQAKWSDYLAFHEIFAQIPNDMYLHLANSSVVRYTQLFDNSHIAHTWCNRGTSGIDGSTSTAVGAASAAPQKSFLLITGDIAFHYDKNALWNNLDTQNLKIIIINNSGGGIFSIIPGPDNLPERASFFETRQNTSALKIAEHYQWSYLAARNEAELDDHLKTFFNPHSHKIILEIFTDADINPQELKKYWEHLTK